MDEIAASVNLTRGALYHHFGDKQGLFTAVVEQIDSLNERTIYKELLAILKTYGTVSVNAVMLT